MKFRSHILVISSLFMLTLMASCTQEVPKTVEGKYERALMHIEKGEYSLAPSILYEITKESPGTKYANYAYLQLGISQARSAGAENVTFDQAEINFQVYLKKNPGSHLAPFVMSRLIEMHYKNFESSIWGEEYGYSRDPSHYRSIVREYQRFYLLFPDSAYLDEARVYRDKAVEALAVHERLIGDWYFEQGYYPSAISRYRFTLDNYPHTKSKLLILERLEEAYRKNHQMAQAEEIHILYEKVKSQQIN